MIEPLCNSVMVISHYKSGFFHIHKDMRSGSHKLKNKALTCTISQIYILFRLDTPTLTTCFPNSSCASQSHSLLLLTLVQTKVLNFVVGPLIVVDVVQLIICNVMHLSVD